MLTLVCLQQVVGKGASLEQRLAEMRARAGAVCRKTERDTDREREREKEERRKVGSETGHTC